MDSPVSIIDYAERAKELGHNVLSTCNHGYQGNYLNTYMVAEKYGLKFLFAAEAYWVKDRLKVEDGKRDKTNNHIVLIARDEIGRKQITSILSEASDSGFYYKPRVDLPLLMSLDPNHVMITSACIGFWGYGLTETEKIVLQLWRKFGNSFFLEVQAHNVEEQKQINRFILSLYRKYGINLIAACDSHYIYPEQDEERKNLQMSTRERYTEDVQSGSADVYYMDYPDGDTLFNRFVEQRILPEPIIEEAIRNTLQILDFEDLHFDRSKKVPNPYPDKTKEERNQMYLDLVNTAWEKYKHRVPKERWPEYEEAIKYETDTIVDTDFADYFLIDEYVARRGKEIGGVITESGRGSGASYFTNSLLGFSSMDRLALPVKMFPDRFVSKPRLLAGKLPDLDLNVAEREPFIEAQKELLGEGHAFPMIAYSTLKKKAAWKMYARAKNIDPDLANKISQQLASYDQAVKYADEDEVIDLADYVSEEYLDLVKESEIYKGIIGGKTIHPCALLIYMGDIRSEIGLVRASSDSGKVDELVTVIDGATAEKFGYLKNDFLKVTVWELITAVYKEIGIPVPDAMDLYEMVKNDKATWKIFADGHTIGVNQCERSKTRMRVMRYKPKNFTELTAFVAAVRPSFQSNLEKFLAREEFSYGIPEFDRLIQTEHMPYSFILYQENIMETLEFAGFEKSECYTVLQHISKKHPEEIEKIKPRFLEGFATKIGGDKEHAMRVSESVWQIISDAAGYGFNCSHAAATAFDALYIAYAKAHYPLQTYRVMLSIYSKRGDKERLAAIKNEMANAFKIGIRPIRFGDDNRDFTANMQDNVIQDAMHSIPYMSKKIAEELYQASRQRFDSWIDALVYLTENTSVNSRQMRILIKLNYFSPFGDVRKLLALYDEFREGKNRYTTLLKDATKEKRIAALKELEREWKMPTYTPYDLAKYQVLLTKSVVGTFDVNPRDYVITNIDAKYSPKITLYSLARGTSGVMKMKKAMFQALNVSTGDSIRLVNHRESPQVKFVNGERVQIPGTKELWIVDAIPLNTNSYAIFDKEDSEK